MQMDLWQWAMPQFQGFIRTALVPLCALQGKPLGRSLSTDFRVRLSGAIINRYAAE